jgi:hypothetical protein
MGLRDVLRDGVTDTFRGLLAIPAILLAVLAVVAQSWVVGVVAAVLARLCGWAILSLFGGALYAVFEVAFLNDNILIAGAMGVAAFYLVKL